MSKSRDILLCEDDPNLGKLLSDYLNRKGFNTTWAQDGADGMRKFRVGSFDFVILDVNMPVKDGFQVAREIRGLNRHVPILFLTARSQREDTLEGFEAGADDYMAKPFSMEELLARIEAIMRRSAALPEGDEEVVDRKIGNYVYDYNRQTLTINGKSSRLTTKENELLFLLAKEANGLLERDFALNAVWGEANYFNGRSMDVYIAKLRKHFKEDARVEILNVHGKGFKLLTS
jgi:two-component system OmpR family response regulator